MLFRYLLLGAVLIYVTFLGSMHQLKETAFPSVDALCPFGGLESLYSLIFHGKFLHRIVSSSFVLLGIILVLTFISGRSFCGWICPLGTLQAIVTQVKQFIRASNLNRKSTFPIRFRYLKYLIFCLFTFGAWYGGKLLIRPYDPWAAFMHISEFEHALSDFGIGMAILGLCLLASLVISRPFCRYLCPMGGFLGILGRFSFAEINRDAEGCVQCKKCDHVCPVNLTVSEEETMNMSECISCGECMTACNKNRAIGFSVKSGSHIVSRVTPNIIAVMVVITFFGGIAVTKATGIYQSKPPSIEQFKASGQFTPEMIKGYMTLTEVAYLFDLNIDDIYSQLALNQTQVHPTTKCKEIAQKTGNKFDTDTVRLGVGALLEIPADQIQTSCTPGAQPLGNQTGQASGQPGFIYGTMTIQEVADGYKIPLSILYKQLGIDIDQIPPNTQCRDLKNLVSPDFHTSKVRAVVSQIQVGKTD